MAAFSLVVCLLRTCSGLAADVERVTLNADNVERRALPLVSGHFCKLHFSNVDHTGLKLKP